MLSETLPQPGFAGQHPVFRFLALIFGSVSGGYVEFRYFGPGQKPKVVDKSAYHELPLDMERIEREVLSRSGRQMITFGPAPRCLIPSKGNEGKDQDVLEVGCIWADLDYKHARQGAIEVGERIRDFPLRPSIVVNSGFGQHVYFIFHEPFSDRAGNLPLWKSLICDLRDVLHGDAVINPSRVMRLPGTLNIKEPRPVECVILDDQSSWTGYSLDEVRLAIETARKKALVAAPGGGDTSTVLAIAVSKLRQRGVPDKIVRAIVTGEHTMRGGLNAGKSDDESGRDYWIACTLIERGFSDGEIRATFRANPNGCGSKWAQKRHGEKYLDITMTAAHNRVEEKKRLRTLGRDVEDNDDNETEGVGLLEEDIPAPYVLKPDGSLWLEPFNPDDEKKSRPVKVCNSPLWISEIQENIESGQITLSIAYRYLEKTRTTKILRSQMADSRQMVAALSGEGAPVTSNNARLVISYLEAFEHAFHSTIPRKRVTSRFGRGRAQGPFFLPGLATGIEFSPNGPGDASLYRAYAARSGSLAAWADLMQAIATERLMIPQVAILTAFVPPLQGKLQLPNFILDIYGNTTTGKSTSLKMAASVYGNPDDKHPDSLILQWTNTKVAIEQIAGMCGDLPVFLDDAQHTPDDLKKTVIYMIANGRGKGRGARGGGLRETPTWRTVALSTSEEPLHESSPHEGARGRLLPVGGLVTPFPPNSGTFVQSLESHVVTNHGHAGETYIRYLNGLTAHEWSELQRRYATVRSQMVRNASSDIVGRVSNYIAAIQVAAEIACPLLGLQFKPDVVSAWLALHLDEQQRDQNVVTHALRILADHYVSNTMLFPAISKNGHGNEESTRENYAGGSMLRRDLQGAVKHKEFVAFTRNAIDTVFQKRKWSSTAVLNKLAEAGALLSTEKDRHTKKVSVDGIQHRMVCIKWSAMLPADVDVAE